MNRRPLILGVGELLWDLLPSGRQLGGAPANFAYHAHSLGAEARVVSRVGNDAEGRDAVAYLQSRGLNPQFISVDPQAPTGTVSVELSAGGTPSYTIHENVAWDSLTATRQVLDFAAQADVICFGTLGQRSPGARQAIQAILQAGSQGTRCLLDVNLRQHFWSRELLLDSLKLANILKLNHEELPVLAGMFGWSGEESQQLRQSAAEFELEAVALTKGAAGSVLLLGGQLVACPGSAIQVMDTVGAGDSYTAALALGILAGRDPRWIIQFAHEVADYVCTQAGAMPAMPSRFASRLT